MSLSAGSWIIFGNLYFYSCTSRELGISSTSGAIDQSAVVLASGTVAGTSAISRSVVVASGVQSWYLVAISTPSVNTLNTTFYAVRVG